MVSTRPLELAFLEQDSATARSGSLRSQLAALVGDAAYGGSARSFTFDDQADEQWATRHVAFEVQPQVTGQETKLIAACYKQLSPLGLHWKKGVPRRGVVDPVQLDAEISGVTIRNHKGEARALYMSCLFAQQLGRFAKEVAALGVTDVQSLGIYNYRCIGGGSPDNRACKVSQHAFGRAIDFESFKTRTGTLLVKADWTKRPPPTCAAQGGSEKDKLLRDIACKAAKQAGFSIFLTPNYNAAHRDHFHADATPGSSFVRGTTRPTRQAPTPTTPTSATRLDTRPDSRD